MSIQPVKISRPRVNKVFPRKHLFKKLDTALEHSVIEIVAPPGSGKTTLLSSYIETRKISCLWYQVDKGDQDVVSLFHYLNLAAKKAAPSTKQTLPLLSQPFRPELKIYARRYFEELFHKLESPLVIVFDNFQEVSEDALFHEIICDGLTQLPVGISAVILSRVPLSPVYSSLRAANKLTKMSEDMLSFTQHETRLMVKCKRGSNVSKESINDLYKITQGWAAGIVLLMACSDTEKNSIINMDNKNLQYVFDYFAGEFFYGISKELKNILLKSVFVDELNAKILKKITGVSKVGELLGELADKNYFTTRHTDKNNVFQFHPLFKEFLLHRVNQLYSKKQRLSLQRKTADVLANNNEVEAAINIFVNTGDWEKVESLLVGLAPSLMDQGRYITLQNWLQLVPNKAFQKHPWLLYWYGSCSQVSDTALSLSLFESGFICFNEKADAKGEYACWCGVMESIVFSFGNYDRLDKWIKVLDQLREKYKRFPSIELSARVSADMHTALWFRQPDHKDLPMWERRVVRLMRLLKITFNAHHRVLVGINLFYQSLWRGDFRKSNVLIETLSPKNTLGKTNAVSDLAWFTISSLYSWLNAEQKKSIELVEKGIEIANHSGVHFWDFMLIAQAAHACLNMGDFKKAAFYHDKMIEVVDKNKQLEMAMLYDFSAQELCHKGEFSRAVVAAETAVYYGAQVGMIFPQGCFRMGYAEVLFEAGEKEEAAKQIKESRKLACKMQSKLILFRVQLLEAYIFLKNNDTDAALKLLKPTLAMGRINAYQSCLWWRTELLVDLFCLALDANIETKYIKKLIHLRKLMPNKNALLIDAWPYPVRIVTLGEFTIKLNGHLLAVSGKAQKRPLNLLKILISMGDRDISQETFFEIMWPDSSKESALQALYTTLHRLRKILCQESAIIFLDGRLRLNKKVVWVDVWSLFSVQKKIDKQLNHEEKNETELNRLFEKICDLYKGSFLLHESEEVSALAMRDLLHRRLLSCFTRLGKYWEEKNRHEQAEECFHKALEVDCLAEKVYQFLIYHYHQQGRSADAAATFLRCRKTLSSNLGVMPSSKTVSIYNNSLAAKKN